MKKTTLPVFTRVRIGAYLIRMLSGCAPEVVSFTPEEGAAARLLCTVTGQ